MATHESSINFQNLIRDLAEMYPFDVAEVVLVELIANSLDAKATRISIHYNSESKTLIIADNGEGMSASQFDEYHDLAAGLKTRGTGIGFAGVGAKISFNIANCVVTETQSDSFSGGSKWYLTSPKKLIWDDIQASSLNSKGTRVEIKFSPEADIPYSSKEHIVKLLKRHYLPLLNPEFLDLYEELGYYSRNFRFVVNDEIINPFNFKDSFDLKTERKFFPSKAGKKIGYGVFGLSSIEYPIGPEICGVLLCTHGKVIKLDFLNQFPGTFSSKIFGVVEIPPFIDFITTAKTDFMHKRGEYKNFESFYGPVREEFRNWLAELGVQQLEDEYSNEARKLERELGKILDEVPELAEFFGFRTRKTLLQQSKDGPVDSNLQEGIEPSFPTTNGESEKGLGPVDTGEQSGEALIQSKEKGITKAKPISRTGKKGPKVSFNPVSGRTEISWVDGNNIIINSGHPSYLKASNNHQTRRLYNIFAIANAVQRFLNEGERDNPPDFKFIDRMMTAWGKL